MSRNFKADWVDGTHEGVDPECEYLDLSRHDLKLEGLMSLMHDVAVDNDILHLNISYNITLEETRDAKKFTEFVNQFTKEIEKNRVLTALDISGNCLGYTTPHPRTPHTLEYVSIISKSLAKTNITHLNISDNNLLGNAGTLYKPLSELVKHYIATHCKLFVCNQNRLHSQAFMLIAQALTHKSAITHLDLSDNLGGVDPKGRSNSEGIAALTTMIGQCQTLRVLKLANNRLRDEDIVSIANSMLTLPLLRTLDISGNSCAVFGAEALHGSIHAHAALKSHNEGLHSLDLSRIALDSDSMRHIARAMGISDSLKFVGLSNCCLSLASLTLIRDNLVDNLELLDIALDGNENEGSEEVVLEVEAEVVTNNLLIEIRSEPDEVDVLTYPVQVLNALRRKLKTLPESLLRRLHDNPSFGKLDLVPSNSTLGCCAALVLCRVMSHHRSQAASPLHEELHRLTPPLRRQLFHKEVAKNDEIRVRLEHSAALNSELSAILLIHRVVHRWYHRVQFKKKLLRADMKAKA